jgi:hypothetical protein
VSGAPAPLVQLNPEAVTMAIRRPLSINNIHTAIRELSARAHLAHRDGREQDAAEIEQRVQGYRDELGRRP